MAPLFMPFVNEAKVIFYYDAHTLVTHELISFDIYWWYKLP